MNHERVATAGTVISQAAIIFFNIDLSTSLAFLPCSFLWRYSLRNHTPNTQPSAICVELTGSHNWLAIITVIAADRAIQKALIWSSSVISPQTVLIILGQNSASPIAIPVPPISNIHIGIFTAEDIQPFITES